MLLRRSFLLSAVSLLFASHVLSQSNVPAPAKPAATRSAQPPAAERPAGEKPAAVNAPAERPAAEKPPGPQITWNSAYVDGPYIAMTFDDGPAEKLTPKLLDFLAAHKMKATFFVVGECVAEFPEIVKRAAREGHEIANHSWSHPNLGKMSDDGVRRELQKTDDAIKAATGVRPTTMRPPYGSITARQKQWIYEEFGYRVIIWDVDPLDWKRPGPSVVRDRIVSQTQPGSIILAHDIHPPTIEAMPSTLEQLQAKGFKFVTVSELLAMSKPAPPKPASTVIPRRQSGDPTPSVTVIPRRQPAETAPSPSAPAALPAETPAGTPNP